MKNETLFKHFFVNKEKLSTKEKINNFSEGGVMAIIISISLIIISSILISNAVEILDLGNRISEEDANLLFFFTAFTYIISYGLIVFIWVRLFKNLSDTDLTI
tara:strand:- start:213 stop:521 length:309 start_codon:yes stop_codon:yes gene_type:complete